MAPAREDVAVDLLERQAIDEVLLEPGLGHSPTVVMRAAYRPAAVRAVLDGVIAKDIAYQPTIQVLYGERDLFDPGFLGRADVRAAVPAEVTTSPSST